MPELEPERLVPDDVIPHHALPPLRYREMPAPIGWRQMVGPSIILAGLALGSGEFILWPFITYKSGFVFFWACLLGVVTQFFLNMEIERWTLLTGESAITGFCRLSKQWAWVFLVLNLLPWIWPGWATGAGQILSWMLFGAEEVTTASGTSFDAPYVSLFAIGGLLLAGAVLTTGPVVYRTVERIQFWLVTAVFALVVILAIVVVEPYAISAMLQGAVNLGGMPPESSGLTLMTLLGALAFAGAGGTTNLGQSNYIKDKGYGMGRYIGRITSPITGEVEATSEIGYHFEHTPENMARWRKWWRAANTEHFFSFFVTCIVCLVLLSLVSYSLFYGPDGSLKPGMDRFGGGMNFIWGQATLLGELSMGSLIRPMFFVLGVVILLTTELGILDTTARISADIIKTNYLAHRPAWTLSKLYYVFLWAEIFIGSTVLLVGFDQPLFLITTSAAMNGGVMLVYSLLLLYLNNKVLSRRLSMSPIRFVALVWSCAFFGFFTLKAFQLSVIPWLKNAI